MGEWGQGSLKGLKLFHRVTFRHKDLALYIYICRERERTSLLVSMDKNPRANAGDTGLIPGPGRFHVLWSN